MNNKLITYEHIPDDVFKHILKYIEHIDLPPIMRVNKKINRLINSLIVDIGVDAACEKGEILTLHRYNLLSDDSFDNICKHGHLRLVKRIINNKIYKLYNFNGNHYLNRGLNLACQYGHSAMVDWFLLNEEININGALISACMYSFSDEKLQYNIDIVKKLMDFGATDMFDDGMITACTYGNIELIKFLKERNHYPNNILYIALQSGNLKSTQFAFSLPHISNCTIAIRDAAIGGNVEIVKLVIDKIISSDFTDPIDAPLFKHSRYATDCLTYACRSKSMKVIDFMLSLGVNKYLCGACRGDCH